MVEDEAFELWGQGVMRAIHSSAAVAFLGWFFLSFWRVPSGSHAHTYIIGGVCLSVFFGGNTRFALHGSAFVRLGISERDYGWATDGWMDGWGGVMCR